MVGQVWVAGEEDTSIACRLVEISAGRYRIDTDASWFIDESVSLRSDPDEAHTGAVEALIPSIRDQLTKFRSVLNGSIQGERWSTFSALEVSAFLGRVSWNPVQFVVHFFVEDLVLGQHVADLVDLKSVRLQHSSLPRSISTEGQSDDRDLLRLNWGLSKPSLRIDDDTCMLLSGSVQPGIVEVVGDSIERKSIQTPSLQLVFAGALEIDVVRGRYMRPLSTLFNFCAGVDGGWTKVSWSIGNWPPAAQVELRGRDIVPQSEAARSQAAHLHLNHVEDDLGATIRRWCALYEDYGLALDYGVGALSRKVDSLRARELGLALEGLSGLVPGLADEQKLADWKAVKQDVRDALAQRGLDDDRTMSEISKAVGRPGLRDRISALASHVQNLGVERYSERAVETVNTLVLVRNGLSHVSPGQRLPTNKEVEEAADFGEELFKLVVLSQILDKDMFLAMADRLVEGWPARTCCQLS